MKKLMLITACLALCSVCDASPPVPEKTATFNKGAEYKPMKAIAVELTAYHCYSADLANVSLQDYMIMPAAVKQNEFVQIKDEYFGFNQGKGTDAADSSPPGDSWRLCYTDQGNYDNSTLARIKAADRHNPRLWV